MEPLKELKDIAKHKNDTIQKSSMKFKLLKGLTHDTLYLANYRNPLLTVRPPFDFTYDLLTKQATPKLGDDIEEFLKEKADWFLDQLLKIRSEASEIDSAIMTCPQDGKYDSITIKAKGRTFTASTAPKDARGPPLSIGKELELAMEYAIAAQKSTEAMERCLVNAQAIAKKEGHDISKQVSRIRRSE
jgi:hypothetical protein